MPLRPRFATPARAASILLPAGLVAGVGFAVTAQAATTDQRVREVAASVVAWPLEPRGGTVVEREVILRPAAGQGLAVYPTAGAVAPGQYLPALNELGSPLVLLAMEREGDWYRVLLPTRPNGSTGWVRAADVTSTMPTYRAELSRAAHELRVIRISDGAVVLTSPIGIGKPSTPTPAGEFFVRDHFPTGTMNHPYGPFAFGLSGHSEVLTQFGTGDGRLAIHGTNQPASIGADLSNGCPHVPNDIALALVDYLPLGTPVTIT